jgi:hypothetical protein
MITALQCWGLVMVLFSLTCFTCGTIVSTDFTSKGCRIYTACQYGTVLFGVVALIIGILI